MTLKELQYDYQEELNRLSLDEFSASCFFTHIDSDEMQSRKRDQFAVDFVYRCYVAGLIMPSAYDDPWHTKTHIEVAQIYVATPKSDIDWHWTQWCTTEETKQVMESFGIDDWDCPRNEAFIAWMLKRFEEAGVPLSDDVLVPLQY
jgi:hypothetical protein